jgi:hypothetical protein
MPSSAISEFKLGFWVALGVFVAMMASSLVQAHLPGRLSAMKDGA